MVTTDNQNEFFDVVDEQDNVIGQATRREVHANKNLIHRSVGVVVINSKGEFLLQQRSSTKDTDPLKWTISCSGHVRSKIENQSASWRTKVKTTTQNSKIYEDAAHRELIEELGIDVPIEFVIKFLCRAPLETEVQALFKAESDGPFAYHPQEIVQGKFFTQKVLKEALEKRELELSFMGKVALEKLNLL